MVKMSQLRQISKKIGTTDKIRELGFELGPGRLWFFRWRGEFLDVIQFWVISNGNGIRVPVSTWIKELERSEYNFSSFPKGFINNRGNPSGMQIGDKGLTNLYYDWWTTTDEQIEDSLKKIVDKIEAFAIPWFDSINSREALFHSLPEWLQQGEQGDKWRAIIFGSS